MEISEIKQRLSIETVLSHYDLHPDRHNFIKCPFHNDEDPSLKIYPETNTFNCFGCGAAGDVIEFIERYNKRGKHEAILKAKSMIDPSAGIIQRAMMHKEEPENDKELLPRLAVSLPSRAYCFPDPARIILIPNLLYEKAREDQPPGGDVITYRALAGKW